MGKEANWCTKYLGSDHHTDRYVRTVVNYEDQTGLEYPGKQRRYAGVSYTGEHCRHYYGVREAVYCGMSLGLVIRRTVTSLHGCGSGRREEGGREMDFSQHVGTYVGLRVRPVR